MSDHDNAAVAARIVESFGDLFRPLIEAVVADELDGRGDTVAILTVERGDVAKTITYRTRPLVTE